MTTRAGVVNPVTLHGARHGSATRMLSAGVPVQVVAARHGHDPTITLSAYAHSDRGGLRAAGVVLREPPQVG
jgi:site-specific recombinase XerD